MASAPPLRERRCWRAILALHPRGVVVIAGFGAVALFAVVRRIVRFWSLAPAGLVLAAVLLVTQRLDRLIIRVPTRSSPGACPVRR